jgi:NAD(P)-dependent dehydrogenase (short-subunit alcohol dehydrogenase family)
MTSWTPAEIPDQAGKTALITGANSGVGYHTTLELARRGAHVTLACRSQARGEDALQRIRSELPLAEVELASLDLADLDSVQKLADGFLGQGRALDILVNNAGVMAIPRRQTTAQGFEMQMGVNHLGHFGLTGRLLPALLARPAARIVTVSSFNHRLARNVGLDDLQSERAYAPWSTYNRSKLANVLFFLELDRRLRRNGQTAVSVGAHPGYAATNLQRSGPQTGGPTLSSRLLAALTPLLAQSEEQGAWPSLYAATAAGVTGGGYYGPDRLGETRGHPRPAHIAKQGRDEDAARRLWEISAELTHVSYEALAAS